MIDEDAGLVLDFEKHEYRYDGVKVPGVGGILAAVGGVDTKWFTAEGRERGTAVHRAMELLVKGQLDWSSVDPRIIGYVDAGRRLIEDARVDVESAV